jgi:hypothetical protein
MLTSESVKIIYSVIVSSSANNQFEYLKLLELHKDVARCLLIYYINVKCLLLTVRRNVLHNSFVS